MVEKETLIRQLKESHGFFNSVVGFKKIELSNQTKEFTDKEQKFIDETWNSLLAKGKVKYSTKIIGVEPDTIRATGDTLHLGVYSVDYKSYKAAIEHPTLEIWVTGPSGIVQLDYYQDRYYLFGERKNSTSLLGGTLETVPGGFLEPKHLVYRDPFHEAIVQELEEETGIPAHFIKRASLLDFGQLEQDPRT